MEESYGFRPKRSCQAALRSIRKWVTYGYSDVIDADIQSYFDTIDHDLLLKLVQRRIRDKWILRLIRRWLKCSIFEQDRGFPFRQRHATGRSDQSVASQCISTSSRQVLGRRASGDEVGKVLR